MMVEPRVGKIPGFMSISHPGGKYGISRELLKKYQVIPIPANSLSLHVPDSLHIVLT